MAEDSNLIEMNCPKCNQPIAFLSKDAGQKGKCPDCGARFIIPARNSQSQVIPKIDTSDLPPSKPKPISFLLPCSDRSSLDNPLDVFCPRCHKLLTFSYDDLWNKGTCPDCGSHFTISEPDYIARYFADVKSGSADTDEFDDVNSSDVHMSVPPSKLHDVFSMKSIFVLIFLFFWQVLIRIIKNFVGDIFSLLFELPFALIVLFLNHWPRFSLDLPWYVCIAYFILAFRVFIGLFRTVIDLPGYFLAFVHLLVYGIDELDA